MSAAQALSETRLLTGEELAAMGDIGPCELIDGRIVSMSPASGRHGAIEALLTAELTAFVRRRKLGRVVNGDTGFFTRRNPDRVRGADVAFVSTDRLPRMPPTGFLDVAPELVVEIVSPTDTWEDLREKIEEYFAIGVERVWVVEPRKRAVLVYRSALAAQHVGETDTLRGEGLLAGFELPVRELFED
jgi:Uma2 family endonuclease